MTRKMTSTIATLSLALGALAFGAGSMASAGSKDVLRLTAVGIDVNPGARARTRSYDIAIERWSTDAEVAKLRDTMTEKGADALLPAVQDLKRVGYIRTTNSVGWDIRFARETVAPDGSRRIVIGTDRPMSFWEAANHPRSADYAFTLAEIRVRPDGKGEGKLVPAAKIDFDKDSNTLEVENYNTEPVRLSEVRIEE
jgi:hypothetical protein